jgi:dienelactone hydrolase
MDVWGLREELYDIARKVAVVGYYVVLPDLYYRQGRIRHQWRNERGQMISMHNLDPERQAQVWRRAGRFAGAASARSVIAWAAAM